MSTFTLPTSINLTSVQPCLENGSKAIDQNTLFFDFTAVTESDTSILAAMFAWLRHAKKQGKTLQFHSIPPTVIHLAKVYGVFDLINPNIAKPQVS